MSSSNSPRPTRRQVLAGCAGCAAAMATPAIAGAQDVASESRPLLGSSALGSRISPEGRRSIAAFDRRFQQERPQMQRTVNAVGDLGLDPSGETPINGDFGAISGMANTRIVFPSDGQFLLTDHISVHPNGPIELACNGCSFIIAASAETQSFTFQLPSGSLISDIVIDQSNGGSVQEFAVRSKGSVHVKNLTIKGYAPATQSVGPTGNGASNVDAMLSPIAETPKATVRFTNFTALAGTAAGTHDDPDKPASAPENRLGAPVGIWVGQSTTGTVQLVNPRLRGWSNGIYGGRTTGKVEILGGAFVNNFNANVRVGGGSVVDGTSILLDDRQWSKKAHPGPYSIGHQGVQAIRVDAKHGNLSTPVTFKNLHIIGNSMAPASSLIDFESAAGPGVLKNCLIENHIAQTVIQGEPPRGDVGQSNILVDHCLIKGTSTDGVMKVTDRPQSRIQNTCITLPKTGPDDIKGAQIGPGVSFGKQCEAGSGLSAPKKVGSGGNLSSLPAPSNNGTGMPGAHKSKIGKLALAGGALVVLVALLSIIGIPALAVGAGTVLSLALAYILNDD